LAQTIWNSFWLKASWHTKFCDTCLVLELTWKCHHCHAISHLCGFITLVLQSCCWCSSPFNSIGFYYQYEWET